MVKPASSSGRRETAPRKTAGHHRRRAYALWIGVMTVLVLGYMIAPGLLPFVDLPLRLMSAPIIVVEILLVLFGVGWLAFYVFGSPEKKDRGPR